MTEILEIIGSLGVVPVVKIEDAGQALDLADALTDGGLPVAEITFRTTAAEAAITSIVDARPDMLVGAGTVLTTEQAGQAIGAGARFIVAPGFNPTVVAYCQKHDTPVFPGVCTPTDIEAALGFGLTALKFFPAEAFGGLKTLKALGGPYGNVKFIPTGGISTNNLADYLASPKVLACGGSWMVAADMISGGQFEKISDLTRDAVAIVKDARSGS